MWTSSPLCSEMRSKRIHPRGGPETRPAEQDQRGTARASNQWAPSDEHKSPSSLPSAVCPCHAAGRGISRRSMNPTVKLPVHFGHSCSDVREMLCPSSGQGHWSRALMPMFMACACTRAHYSSQMVNQLEEL